MSEFLSLLSQRAGLVALALALLALPLILKLLHWVRHALRPKRHVVVDGSNVMHWKDNTPDLQVLRAVVAELKRRGYTPGVGFDANAGWKLMGRYRHDGAMASLLGLPVAQVMVVPKGQVADGWILAAARDLGAPVVTNDRYRDWAEAHPEVTEPGRLIRGGVREGKVWLDLGGGVGVNPGVRLGLAGRVRIHCAPLGERGIGAIGGAGMVRNECAPYYCCAIGAQGGFPDD